MQKVISKVTVAVQEILGDQYKCTSFEKKLVNGGSAWQINVRKEGVNISPNVPIEGLMEKFDGEIDAVAHQVAEMAKEAFNRSPSQIDLEIITNSDFIRSNCYFQLVNKEMNKQLCEGVVCKDFLDLVAIVRVYINENMSFMLKKEMIDTLGMTEQEVMEAAEKNTKKTFESKSLTNLLDEITGVDMNDDERDAGENMTVLTNKNKYFGATYMMYADMLQAHANKIGQDFFVLPSSIHECIAVPAGACEVGVLLNMVRHVNNTELLPEERLSDSVYLFSKDQGRLTKVA